MHKTKNDLPIAEREKLVKLLNDRLADGIDLRTQTKQAHWNVKGMNFIALHELFDQIYVGLEPHIDDIAERITVLGGIAEGTARVVASKSNLQEYPLEISSGESHVEALSTALATFGTSIRSAIGESDKLGDADTADLFTGISRDVDKFVWFVEAHQQ